MNYRTLLYLAVTAACLGLLLWLLDQRDHEQRIAQSLPDRPLAGLDASAVVRLDIEHQDHRFVLERHDRTWRITQPIAARADTDRVHRLLAHLEQLVIRSAVTPDEWAARDLHPRDFGLAPPASSITLATGTDEYTLWIGCESPMDNGLYVRTPDEPTILLTDRRLIELLPQSLDGIREQIVVDGVAEDVVRIDIKPYGGHFIQLARAINGRWVIRQPVATRTEPDVVRRRLDRLMAARIESFLPADGGALLSGYDLDDDEATLALTLWKSGATHGTELFFGRETGENSDSVFARRGDSDGVFIVPRDVRDAFLVSPDNLRDRRILQIDPWTVDAFQLRAGKETVALTLTESGWQVTQPVQWRADDEMVMDTLIRIVELRAQRFIAANAIEPADTGLDDPRYALTVWTANGGAETPTALEERQASGRILIGNPVPDDDAYFARRDGDPAIFTLSAADLDGRLIATNRAGVAFTDPLMYRDRSVMSIQADAIWRIEHQHGERRRIIDRDGDTWTVAEPAGYRVDMRQVETILGIIADLRALRVEHRSIEQPAAFGFDQPGLILTFHVSGTDGLAYTLVTGFRARTDGIFARVQGRDLVFAIDRITIDRLSRDPAQAPDGQR